MASFWLASGCNSAPSRWKVGSQAAGATSRLKGLSCGTHARDIGLTLFCNVKHDVQAPSGERGATMGDDLDDGLPEDILNQVRGLPDIA